MESFLSKSNNIYINKLIKVLTQNKSENINRLHIELYKAWKSNRNIYICGNGGSAGNANHIANDLIFAAGKKNKKGLKVESLSANSSVITCLANDLGYENIYAEQINVKGSKNDLLIVLSGSGNSKNISKAIIAAKKIKMKTFGIFGFNGGRCKDLVDDYIHYKINDMQISEDIQMIVFNSCIQKLMKQKLGK